jgi:hypothetical protein
MERLVTVEEVRKAVEKIGFNYVADRALTLHRGDWYLRVVVGFKIREDRETEYAVWLLNADRKEPGLYEGFYTTDKQEAEEKYKNKR